MTTSAQPPDPGHALETLDVHAAKLVQVLAAAGSLTAAQALELLEQDQWERWHRGERVPAEAYVNALLRHAAAADGFTLVYGEFLVREALGEQPNTEEYIRRFPGYTDRFREQLELHRALASGFPTPSTTLQTGPARDTASDLRPSLPGYEVMGELGRGGMGVVYEARHQALGRHVALKMLRYDDDGEVARSRFRREAEAVARLQHPNVVQIFEVGEHERRPYLALEFVEGGSLAQRIAGRPEPTRAAALLVAVLARAIDHAHKQGIVHRDLKPANVLLTRDGTPKITDFGLARHLDSSVDQTKSGTIVGTASYMAPEQASGKANQAGPAADVYALGAILYELLTGRPPFQAETPMAIVLQVLHVEPVPPRRLQPGIPRDLETICLKCLQKDARKRYASAQDLAEDLQRFLGGTPIQARPTPSWERAWKWARREPKAAVLGALVVGVTIAAFAGITWQLQRTEEQRQNAETQGQNAETQRLAAETARGKAVELARSEAEAKQEAEQNARAAVRNAAEAVAQRDEARKVVDKFCTQVSESPEMKAKATEGLRTKLLETAADFYRRRADQEGNDLLGRTKRAEALHRLADIYKHTERVQEAETVYREVLVVWQQLAAAQPHNSKYRNNIASVYNGLGLLWSSRDQLDKALENYRLAEEVFLKLVADYPDDLENHLNLATVRRNLGNLYERTGRTREAEASQRDAVKVLRKIVANKPEVPLYRFHLATAYYDLGSVYQATSRAKQAEQSYRDAVAEVKRLVTEKPEAHEYRHHLAASYHSLGLLYQDAGQTKQAEQAYLQARAESVKLAGGYPAIVKYQEGLATAEYTLGKLYADKQPRAAEEYYKRALTIRQRLTAAHPDRPSFQNRLASCHQSLAVIYRATGRTTEAEVAAKQALTIAQHLSTQHPRVFTYREVAAMCHNELGLVYFQAKNLEQAEESLRKAASLFGELAVEQPKQSRYSMMAGVAQVSIGKVVYNRGRREEALEGYNRGIQLLTAAFRTEQPTLEARTRLLDAHTDRAQLLSTLGRHADAVLDWRRAMEVDAGKKTVHLQLALAFALARAGDHREADTAAQVLEKRADTAAQVVEKREATGPSFYQLARVYALASVAADKDEKLTQTERARHSERYASRAIELLQKAKATGAFNDGSKLGYLKKPDLDSLRGRPDFKKLFPELEPKTP
jgi:tetratricopeptide (TPR) repeat protein/tRNA A-37 threonylcarbamoyl transferase component Bud32